HEKGSFTGAQERRTGIFERADGGTLFLDEITEMPTELQVKLLRILETGEVTRIGGGVAKKVDVRLISATNRDPEQAVSDGKLREDLLYRLNVFPVELPPLRDRDDDVGLLAHAFLDSLNQGKPEPKRFSDEALARLSQHDWPGNVRELKNVVERAWIMGGEIIGADAVPLGTRRPRATQSGHRVTVEVGTSIATAEKALILATLEQLGGNKREAAAT
ncbi:MAG: sigma-54-dependent Fis family transcriptional regulator, partial [Gemmatimonadetes bacterium]|nr:sigma-54-dependent Fis family transcriptional regulator [Gemmatimonadota bacterium]